MATSVQKAAASRATGKKKPVIRKVNPKNPLTRKKLGNFKAGKRNRRITKRRTGKGIHRRLSRGTPRRSNSMTPEMLKRAASERYRNPS